MESQFLEAEVKSLLAECLATVLVNLKVIHSFSWDDYFNCTGANPASSATFKLLNRSTKIGIDENDEVEIVKVSRGRLGCWPAKVDFICGPLLRLKYVGFPPTESNCDFWLDCREKSVKQPGYARRNGIEMIPPEGPSSEIISAIVSLQDISPNHKANDCCETNAKLNSLSDSSGSDDDWYTQKCTPLSEHFSPGRILTVINSKNVPCRWPAEIVANCDGYLGLRYYDPGQLKCDDLLTLCPDFWFPCTSTYLRPLLDDPGCVDFEDVGGCDRVIVYADPNEPTAEPISHFHTSPPTLPSIFESLRPLAAPSFAFQQPPGDHNAEPGYALEMVDPVDRQEIKPFVVREIIDSTWVEVVCGRTKAKIHRESPYVLPVGFCRKHTLQLRSATSGSEDHDWAAHFRKRGGKAMDVKKNSGDEFDRFTKGSKLEALHPSEPGCVVAATVVRVVPPLVWLYIDAFQSFDPIIYDLRNYDLFPCGWAEQHGFKLMPPKWDLSRPEIPTVDHCDYTSEQISLIGHKYKPFMPKHYLPENCPWSPAIYFNPYCYLGPYIGRPRFVALPRQVGPGPLRLVVRKVLCLLVSASTKPRDMLSELQPEQSGPVCNGRETVLIKARSVLRIRGKAHTGTADSCKDLLHLPQFLRNVCIQLHACPSMIGFFPPKKPCPDNCQKFVKNADKSTSVVNPQSRKRRRPSLLFSAPLVAEQMITRRKAPRFAYNAKLAGQPADVKRGTAAGESVPSRQKVINGTGMGEAVGDIYGGSNGVVSRAEPVLTQQSFAPMLKRSRLSPISDLGSSFSNNFRKGTPNEEKIAASVIEKLSNRLSVDVKIPFVDSDPLRWSVSALVQFISRTDAASVAHILKDEEVDGQAFLLLNLELAMEYLQLNLGPAVKLCSIADKLKQTCLKQNGREPPWPSER